MSIITLDEPGKEVLLLGNEAIARGALEAGVKFCSAYPGTPSTEIVGSLAQVAKQQKIYVEWSVNEKVALEVAAAASFSGLRAICAMKQNGINVASDFLLHLNMVGVKGGLVVVTCDDPSAHSSPNEQDSRIYAKLAKLPLLEPATFQEAKDMTKWGFALSEKIGNVCMMRGVTRINHARGNVRLGEFIETDIDVHYDTTRRRLTQPVYQTHQWLEKNLRQMEEIFDTSTFNYYVGPRRPDILIITCGSGLLYSEEAVDLLGLNDSAGILKIGTTWPLPRKMLAEHLKKCERILIVEEVDPFLEGNVKEVAADVSKEIGQKVFFGKRSEHIPSVGEIDTDCVVDALARIMDKKYERRNPSYEKMVEEKGKEMVPERSMAFCSGCPHRASFWSINSALKKVKGDGFVAGDIGCYSLARGATGYFLLQTNLGMGSGTGLASGFGKLDRFKFEQPVIAVCGDSTFFHSAMPALVNGHYNRSNFILVILDNSATAMTGFQPHPGVGVNAMGDEVAPLSIEKICQAFGAKVEVTDPFDLKHTKRILLQMLNGVAGPKVLIMRRKCALLEKDFPYRMRVDSEQCTGCELCAKVFKCPGLVWDDASEKAQIDEVLCVGCGLCADVCPLAAIIREEVG
jgi:indolepyruvate ferredoxin oxidoreductase alpha subunit